MKFNREFSFALGSLIGPTATLIVSAAVTRDLYLIYLFSGIHLFVSVVISGALVLRAIINNDWQKWTPRELFMLPSLWIFLSPLWAACAVFVYEWHKDDYILHHGVTILLIILILPSLWIFFRLSGTRFR